MRKFDSAYDRIGVRWSSKTVSLTTFSACDTSRSTKPSYAEFTVNISLTMTEQMFQGGLTVLDLVQEELFQRTARESCVVRGLPVRVQTDLREAR